MPKLKIGDKFVYTKEMNEAKMASYYKTDLSELIGETAQISVIDKDSYQIANYPNYFEHNVIDSFLPSDLRPEITWETLKEGDFLENDGLYKVLGRVGDVVFLSQEDTFEYADSFYYTIYELKESDYLIVQPILEETNEMTLDEVCKALGKTIKIIKSK